MRRGAINPSNEVTPRQSTGEGFPFGSRWLLTDGERARSGALSPSRQGYPPFGSFLGVGRVTGNCAPRSSSSYGFSNLVSGFRFQKRAARFARINSIGVVRLTILGDPVAAPVGITKTVAEQVTISPKRYRSSSASPKADFLALDSGFFPRSRHEFSVLGDGSVRWPTCTGHR